MLGFFVLTWVFLRAAMAGVFDIPHFVPEGQFSVGLEPELTLTGKASLGVNGKFTYGLGEILNLGAAVGTGGGDRGFRMGSYAVFDVFPDVEGQPGIGVAGQFYYQRFTGFNQYELTAVPYIHKALKTGENEFEPFIGFPFGTRLRSEANGGNQGLVGVNVGSMFQKGEHLQFIIELGVEIHHTPTTVSGGVVYYY